MTLDLIKGLFIGLFIGLIIAAVYYYCSRSFEKKAKAKKEAAYRVAAKHDWNRTKFKKYVVDKIGFDKEEFEGLWDKFIKVCSVGNIEYFWENYVEGDQNYFLQHLEILQVKDLPESIRQTIFKECIEGLKKFTFFNKEYIDRALVVFKKYIKLFNTWDTYERNPKGYIAKIIMSCNISNVRMDLTDDELQDHLISLCEKAIVEQD